MMAVDEALMKADDANYSSEAEITLAAEVRRLREELSEWKSAAGVAGLTVGVLKEENERLRKDAAVGAMNYTATPTQFEIYADDDLQELAAKIVMHDEVASTIEIRTCANPDNWPALADCIMFALVQMHPRDKP